MTFHQKTLQSFDGTDIFYEVTKVPRSKMSLFLLHGLGGSLSAWNQERELLNELGYSTYAIDLRGHGKSGRPVANDAYELTHFAQDVSAVIAAEKAKNVVLVGHCMGGMVALTTEIVSTASLEALVLIDTTYKPPLFSERPRQRAFLQRLLLMMSNVTPHFNISNRVDFSVFVGTGDFNVHRIFSDVIHTSPYTYLLLLRNMLGFDIKHELSKVALPSLVIVGDEDRVFPPVVSEELATLLPKAEFVRLSKANHIPVFNNPNELVDEMSAFLDTL